MCKDLCEQSDEGRQLWERWRTHGDNWQAVSRFHRDAVIAAMRADAIKRQTESLARGGPYMVFLCPRDEEQA